MSDLKRGKTKTNLPWVLAAPGPWALNSWDVSHLNTPELNDVAVSFGAGNGLSMPGAALLPCWPGHLHSLENALAAILAPD